MRCILTYNGFRMATENEVLPSMAQREESRLESLKHPKRAYAREFLLSLSKLEICKKLPNGFDESILSEFDDASHGNQDRQKTTGGLSTPGFRRNDYGSAAPARGDMSNYPRGLNRWDSRSSGRSDTDSDSESGRHYNNQPRRSWQNSEHDGLLGSGSFPRPQGYASGASVPRFRSNDHGPLNRSNDPYHPPRPYKAPPHLRRETNDSLNDETFGSNECTSEDRVEEERKRRAEFESMRKEQQKALQEKQKLNPEKLNADPFSEISAPREDKVSSEVSEPMMKPALQNDSGKLSVSSQGLPSRPLVPPGFVNATPERNSGPKSLVHTSVIEVAKLKDSKNFAELRCETTTSSVDKGEKNVISSASGAPDHAVGIDTHSSKSSAVPHVSEILENGEMLRLDTENGTRTPIIGESGHPTSLLEKLFGGPSTITCGGSASVTKDHDIKKDDVDNIWGADAFQPKFSHWFLEDGKKSVENFSGNSNDLLSLIVGGEKGGSRNPVPTMHGESKIQPTTSNLELTKVDLSDQIYESFKHEPKPAVLTCEDLEQSILSEIVETRPNAKPPGHSHRAFDVKADEGNASVDNLASQHLLSLLQQGSVPNNMERSNQVSPEKHNDFEVRRTCSVDAAVSDGKVASLGTSGKTLTLETLFGTSFMKELQSFEAPVLAARDSDGSARGDTMEPYGSLFPNVDGDFLISSVSETGSVRKSQDSSVLVLNDSRRSNLDYLRLDSPRMEMQNDVGSKFTAFDRGDQVRLPEEDNLIAVREMPSTSNIPVNIVEKLGALSAGFKDERPVAVVQEGPPFLHRPFDALKPEIPFQNVLGQSSPHFHLPQTTHGTPLFHPLDPHPARFGPRSKFMTPEPHHQFHANMGHPPYPHPKVGLPGFDQPVHHAFLPRMQMHVPANVPPPHVLPLHPIQEHNPMPGFPFGQRQPSLGALGPALPVPEVGAMNTTHPEAFQKLLDRELRTNPKPMHHFAQGGHGGGLYGHERDTGFRHR